MTAKVGYQPVVDVVWYIHSKSAIYVERYQRFYQSQELSLLHMADVRHGSFFDFGAIYLLSGPILRKTQQSQCIAALTTD